MHTYFYIFARSVADCNFIAQNENSMHITRNEQTIRILINRADMSLTSILLRVVPDWFLSIVANM